MTEWEWIVCKACGKTGWLDLHQPMNQTGWTHTYHLNEKNENVNYYLCDGCSCMNCPDAIVTTQYNEDGSTYPDPKCQLPDGCKYLHNPYRSSTDSIEERTDVSNQTMRD